MFGRTFNDIGDYAMCDIANYVVDDVINDKVSTWKQHQEKI